MRKLTPRRKRWLSCRQRNAHRQHCRGRRLRKISGAKQSAFQPITVYTPSERRKIGMGIATPMPKILCFSRNPAETLESLDGIRSSLQDERERLRNTKKKKNTRIRLKYSAFENIEDISPSAALVLAAEYERAYHLNGSHAIVVNLEKWHPTVMGILKPLGFFEKFGFDGILEAPDVTDRFRILPMRSGSSADSPAVNMLISDLKGLYPLADVVDEDREAGMLSLYGAMVEALVNVVRHAYPEGRELPFTPVNRWWMAGAVDQDARQITAMVFDQGITIPLSLPNWQHYAGVRRRIVSFLGLVPDPGDTKCDGLAIAAAVEESVSSTGERHRGRGLAQMRDFVDQCRGGYLRIMSRCGEVIMYPREKPTVRAYDISIGGTLIEWNVII
jgi:anti-sigma regulatory factor (Ser/Thr protein kinase)